MYYNGIPEKNISGITVTDCLISSRRGADIRYSDGVVLRDVGIRQEEGPGFSFANCRSVSLAGCTDSSGEVSSEDIFRHNSPDVITEKGKR